jgi:hypothetical protein
MSKAQVALALSDALEGRDATVLSELGCLLTPMRLTHPQAWYQEPHAGGPGRSLMPADADRHDGMALTDNCQTKEFPIMRRLLLSATVFAAVLLGQTAVLSAEETAMSRWTDP